MLMLIVLWIAAAAATLWWLMSAAAAEPEPAGPAGDPWADEVARFRREMHDWDRG